MTISLEPSRMQSRLGPRFMGYLSSSELVSYRLCKLVKLIMKKVMEHTSARELRGRIAMVDDDVFANLWMCLWMFAV